MRSGRTRIPPEPRSTPHSIPRLYCPSSSSREVSVHRRPTPFSRRRFHSRPCPESLKNSVLCRTFHSRCRRRGCRSNPPKRRRTPNSSFVPVGRKVEHAGLRQRDLVVTHCPAGIGTSVTVGCPACINDAVDQKKRGAVLVLLGIEYNTSVCAVIAGTRICRSDFNRPAELFRARRYIEGVESVVVSAAGILSHSNNVNRAMRAGRHIDNRRRSNSDYRLDRATTAVCRKGFPPFPKPTLANKSRR